MNIRIKRVYEAPGTDDGTRILVDGLWPRGLSKAQARVNLWLKEIAPTAGLRAWFGHDPENWAEFRKRYKAELEKNRALVLKLGELLRRETVTLVYAAKDQQRNNAVVLKEHLEKIR